MFDKIVQMEKNLLEMDVDTYNEARYTLQAQAKGKPGLERFIKSLFAFVDAKRPLLIEMKGGAV